MTHIFLLLEYLGSIIYLISHVLLLRDRACTYPKLTGIHWSGDHCISWHP
jgi:hypothetical protein